MDSDADYLYATHPSRQSVAVLDASGGVLTEIAVGAPVTALDASSASWVYVATPTSLLRWRKPPPP
jgi:hypothetical protein